MQRQKVAFAPAALLLLKGYTVPGQRVLEGSIIPAPLLLVTLQDGSARLPQTVLSQALRQDRLRAAPQIPRQGPRRHHVQDRRSTIAGQKPFQAGGHDRGGFATGSGGRYWAAVRVVR